VAAGGDEADGAALAWTVVQQDKLSQPNGSFRDDYFLCGATTGCESGANCLTVASQTFRIDFESVCPASSRYGPCAGPGYTLIYTCQDVTVQ
jgi:hypothetical protein